MLFFKKVDIWNLKNIQEPGANASEIFATLKHVRPGDNFVPNFELFAKTDVSINNRLSTYPTLIMVSEGEWQERESHIHIPQEQVPVREEKVPEIPLPVL